MSPRTPERALALTIVSAASVFFVALVAAYLVLSRGASMTVNVGVDWAHHVALADALLLGEDLETKRPQLAEFSDHPRLAHHAATLLARASGLPPLRTIHIVATASVLLALLLAAARMVLVAFRVGDSASGAIAGVAAGCFVLWSFSLVAAGFVGQIQYNFFFSQAAATAAAIAALIAVQSGMAAGGRPAWVAFAGVPLLSVVLAQVHTAPALWFAASGAACALSLAGSWRRRLSIAAALVAASAVLVVSLPSTRAMMQLGQRGGGDLNLLPLGKIWQLNVHPGFLMAGLVALAALLALLWLVLARRSPDERRFAVFNLHCGAIGLVALCVPILGNLLVKGGEGYYPLAKYVYIFGAEAALIAAHFGALVGRRWASTPLRPAWAAVALVIAILPQEWWSLRWSRDISYLVGLRNDLLRARPKIPTPAPYPVLDPLSPAERFYLSISPMGRSRDEAFPLLFNANLGGDPAVAARLLPASLAPSAAPEWIGKEIRFDARSAHAAPVLVMGQWGVPGELGRWTAAPAAHLTFRIPVSMRGANLCLRLLAPAMAPGTSLESTFMVGARGLHAETFSGEPRNRVVALPLATLGPTGDVSLSIVNEFRPPTADDARRGAVGLQAMWVGARCQ